MSELGWILAVVGLVLALGGYVQRRKFQKMNSVPYRKPSEIAQQGLASADAKGMVSTEGSVVPLQTLLAPMTGQPCLAYQVTIERKWEREESDGKGGTHNRSGTDTVHTAYEGSIFQLRDELGSVSIDASALPDVTLEKTHSNTERVGLSVPTAMAFGQMQFQTPKLPRDSRTTSFVGTEKILRPAGNLYVMGAIEARGDGPVISKPKGLLGSLLLSTMGRSELLKKTQRQSKIAFGAAAALFVIGAPMGIFGSHSAAASSQTNNQTTVAALNPVTGTSTTTTAAVAPGQALAFGTPATGELQSTDQALPEGAGFADDYSLALTAGQPITILTNGGARAGATAGETVDVVTAVLCNGQEVARDDDGGGGLNSRIEYTPTTTALCTVRVMGFAGQLGPYTVRAVNGTAPAVADNGGGAEGSSVCARAVRCCQAADSGNPQMQSVCERIAMLPDSACQTNLASFRRAVRASHRALLSQCD